MDPDGPGPSPLPLHAAVASKSTRHDHFPTENGDFFMTTSNDARKVCGSEEWGQEPCSRGHVLLITNSVQERESNRGGVARTPDNDVRPGEPRIGRTQPPLVTNRNPASAESANGKDSVDCPR